MAWEEIAKVLVGLVVGSVLTLVSQEIREGRVRRNRQNGILSLLLSDLTMASVFLKTPNARDEEYDLSLWRALRVDLSQTGADKNLIISLVGAYRLLEMNNAATKRGYPYDEEEPSRRQKELQKVIDNLSRTIK